MQVYVDGLADELTERDLVPLFSGVSSVGSMRVIRDIESGRSRGFALVTIGDEAEGKEAIARLNGNTLRGRKLTVFRIHDTLPGEMEFREWLRDNAVEVLGKAGVSKSHTVVDYGCGPGVFSLAAAKLVGRSGKVYAMDVRPHALEQVKAFATEEGLNNVETLLLDRTTVSLALESASADAVLLYDVLQEIRHKDGLMKEIHRILRPGGVLSVFPMHLGTKRLLELVETLGFFRVRDRLCVSGFQSASEIVNLSK